MDSIAHFLITYGYLGLFLLLMVGIVGLPIPDEAFLTFAGYLVFAGIFQPLPTAVAAILGTLCGITVSYSVGRSAGAYLLNRYGHRLRISPEKLARLQAWFHRAGKWAFFFGFFITGMRHLTALAAGSSRVRFRLFAVFAYPGGILWALSFIGLGYFLGEEIPIILQQLSRVFIITSAVVILLIITFVALKHFRNRKNRKLVS